MERIAILSFDNQSGDPTLDWINTAAPSILAAQLSGLTAVEPLRAQTLGDAYADRATLFLEGTFTKTGGSLNFVVPIEDAVTHKTTRVIHADGSLLTAANRMARAIDAQAHPFTTSNEDAVAAWGQGNFERAVAIDPDFGQAWMAWVQMLAASKDSARAIDVASQALGHPLQGDLEHAQIELLLASLRNDESAQSKALARLVQLMPSDTTVIKALADQDLSRRNFTAAADLDRAILRKDPENIVAMNALGYAEACAGNLDAARHAFDEYGRQPGQTANALDSLGEAYFMNGKFADAEKYFLQAHQRQPGLMNGGDLLKAAYAHWLGGDLPGADAIFQRYLQFRAGLHDQLLVWRQADWLYATGRMPEALAKLKSAPPGEASLVEKQLAVWRSPSGGQSDVAPLKAIYEKTPPPNDGPVRVLYATALLAAGEKDQARELCRRWPLPGAGDSLTESPMFPRFLELRKHLGIQ